MYIYLEVNPKNVISEFKFNERHKIKEMIGKRCWEITNGKDFRVYLLDDNRILYNSNKDLNTKSVLTFCFKYNKKFKVWDVSKEEWEEMDANLLTFYFSGAIEEVILSEFPFE